MTISTEKLCGNINRIEDECEQLITEINHHLLLNVIAKVESQATPRTTITKLRQNGKKALSTTFLMCHRKFVNSRQNQLRPARLDERCVDVPRIVCDKITKINQPLDEKMRQFYSYDDKEIGLRKLDRKHLDPIEIKPALTMQTVYKINVMGAEKPKNPTNVAVYEHAHESVTKIGTNATTFEKCLGLGNGSISRTETEISPYPIDKNVLLVPSNVREYIFQNLKECIKNVRSYYVRLNKRRRMKSKNRIILRNKKKKRLENAKTEIEIIGVEAIKKNKENVVLRSYNNDEVLPEEYPQSKKTNCAHIENNISNDERIKRIPDFQEVDKANNNNNQEVDKTNSSILNSLSNINISQPVTEGEQPRNRNHTDEEPIYEENIKPQHDQGSGRADSKSVLNTKIRKMRNLSETAPRSSSCKENSLEMSRKKEQLSRVFSTPIEESKKNNGIIPINLSPYASMVYNRLLTAEDVRKEKSITPHEVDTLKDRIYKNQRRIGAMIDIIKNSHALTNSRLNIENSQRRIISTKSNHSEQEEENSIKNTNSISDTEVGLEVSDNTSCLNASYSPDEHNIVNSIIIGERFSSESSSPGEIRCPISSLSSECTSTSSTVNGNMIIMDVEEGEIYTTDSTL